MSKGLYVTGAFKSEDIQRLIEGALESGAKEIHLGYQRCAFCAEGITPQIQELVLEKLSGEQMLYIHLCSRCYKEYRQYSGGKPIYKG